MRSQLSVALLSLLLTTHAIAGGQPSDPGSPSPIPLRLKAFVMAPSGDGRSRVRLVAEVDPAAVRFEERDGVLGATLESSTWVTVQGEVEGSPQSQRDEIRLSHEQLAEAQAGWLPLRSELRLAAGAYEARVQVSDPATGRLGTVRHSFEVPTPDTFRLTTPVLTDRLLPEGSGRELARRQFAPGSRLFCEFEVLGAEKDGSGASQVDAGLLLLRTDGVALVRSEPLPIPLSPDGHLVRRFALNLKDLLPGEYAIQLTARDLLGGKEITRREPFVIQVAAPALTPFAATPLPAGVAPPARKLVGQGGTAFLDLLGQYRQGDRKQVLRSLLDWPKGQLEASLRNIESGAIACPSLCLRTTLLLELEFSVLQRSLHNDLGQARRLARRLDYSDWGFRRDWLLAAGLALRMEGKLLAPIDIFSECAQEARVLDPLSGRVMRVGSDVECQLALASTYEARAHASLPDAGPFARLPSTAQFPRDARASAQAEDAYQRALRLAPESDEAHLRYGRYLQRRGETERAEPELTRVLDHSQVAHHRVLAHLFLGRMAEAAERFQDAASHYRAALEEEPTCQAARVALSHALLRSGRHREAIEAARAALAAPDDPEALESWLAYRLNVIFEYERKMRSLSERLGP